MKPAKHGRDHNATGEDPISVMVRVQVVGDTTTLTTGDAKRTVTLWGELGGSFLRTAHATLVTASSSGTPTIQIRNITGGYDMLSTKITVDANEYTSHSAAVPHVVDRTGSPQKNLVAVGDRLAIDVDVAGTGAAGLAVLLEFGPDLMRALL